MSKRICFVSSRTGYVHDVTAFSIDWANGRLIDYLNQAGTTNFSAAIFADPQAGDTHNLRINVHHVYRFPFPYSQWGGFINVFRIYKMLKRIEKENDLLIVQLPMIGFPGLSALRKPVIYHVCANVLTAVDNPVKYRGVMAPAVKVYARMIHAFNRKLFKRHNTRLIVNGSELGRLYADFDPVAVISSSMLDDDIVTTDRVADPSGRLNIVFIGRPSLEKGFDILLQALSGLGVDFHLTVIGFTKGEMKSLSPLLTSALNPLASRTTFLGRLNWGAEFKRVLQSQSVLVVPSRSEGTPRVILEAMSQGVPVIASRIGGIPDVIEHRESGLLFQPGSAEDLAAQLSSFAADNELQKKISLSGIRLAKRNTIEQFAGAFIKCIQSLE